MSIFLLLVLLPLCSGFGTLCDQYDPAAPIDFSPLLGKQSRPEPNLKVAWVGDIGPNDLVLNLVRQQSPDFLVIAGDFDYGNNPVSFHNRLDTVFGPTFPIFGAIGNHDTRAWTGAQGYGPLFRARMERSGALSSCVWVNNASESPGSNTVCNYKGITFILSGIATRGTNHVDFVDSAFRNVPAMWRHVCWHKNQKNMQLGTKNDETGYAIYEISRVHGAVAITGHEHSYCRSRNMARYSASPLVADLNRDLRLRDGQNYLIVTGLGGQSIRAWTPPLQDNPWWASAWASNNGVQRSTTICTYNVNGNPRQADCIQIDVNGRTYDSWTMYTEHPEFQASTSTFDEAVDCIQPFLELPVSESNDDASVILGANAQDSNSKEVSVLLRVPEEKVLTVGGASNQGVLLSFDVYQVQSSTSAAGCPHGLLRERAILESHLQMKGTQGLGATSILIRGVVGETHGGQGLETLLLSSNSVLWSLEDDGVDWEDGEIWNSPDVSKIVAELLPTLQGPRFTFLLTPVHGAPRAFMSIDGDRCNTPHLTIQLASGSSC